MKGQLLIDNWMGISRVEFVVEVVIADFEQASNGLEHTIELRRDSGGFALFLDDNTGKLAYIRSPTRTDRTGGDTFFA